MEQTTQHKNRWFRIGCIVVGVLLTTILSLVIWIQTTWGKNFVRIKAVNYLQEKVGGKITIGTLNYSIPHWVQLDNVQIISPENDTLLNGQSLYVNLSIFKLIGGNIDVNEIHLKHIHLNINRKPNNPSFNFQYIIDAFATKKKDTTAKKQVQLSVSKVILDTVSVGFSDGYKKLFFKTSVGQFTSRIDAMDIYKMNFAINDFMLKNSSFVIIDKSTKDAKAVKATEAESTTPLTVTL